MEAGPDNSNKQRPGISKQSRDDPSNAFAAQRRWSLFSIDEFGPFAVKMRGGKSLQGPKQLRMVPQWQVSKGSLIVSAALDLSKNQVQHFFSERKNTCETIKLVELIRKEYKSYRRVYLFWDAAPWHSSELFEKIEFLNGWAKHDCGHSNIASPSRGSVSERYWVRF
jgi:hypothetical protein